MPGTINLSPNDPTSPPPPEDGGDVIGNPDAYDQAAGDQYRDYQINTTFGYDPGVLVFPVATSNGVPAVEVIRTHGGIGTRRVRFGGMKTGTPLVLPAAVNTDKDLLIQARISVPLPSPNPQSGGYTWAAQGEYLYVTADAINGPRIPGVHHLPTGQYPFPLTVHDAIAEAIGASSPDEIESLADDLSDEIADNNYVWPLTLYPAGFFNPLLLRED